MLSIKEWAEFEKLLAYIVVKDKKDMENALAELEFLTGKPVRTLN